MKANRRARWIRGDDGGALLLLAGIILIGAFVFSALTLSQIADLKKQATDDLDAQLITEYRFLRLKIGTTISDAVDNSTNNATFRVALNTTVTNLKATANDRGYDLVVQLASRKARLTMDEWNFTRTGYPHNFTSDLVVFEPRNPTNLTAQYNFHTYDNLVNLEVTDGGSFRKWDGNNDGIVWVDDCLSGASGGCIQAAILYVYLADERSSIDEFIAYSFNPP